MFPFVLSFVDLCEFRCVPMSTTSPEHRIRNGSIRLGLWASLLTFLLIEIYALPDQWEVGRASVAFVLAFLGAGVSIGLFAVIVVTGMVASRFLLFSERSHGQSPGPSGSNGPMGYGSRPRAAAGTILIPISIKRSLGHAPACISSPCSYERPALTSTSCPRRRHAAIPRDRLVCSTRRRMTKNWPILTTKAPSIKKL